MRTDPSPIRVGVAQYNYHTRARFGSVEVPNVRYVREYFLPVRKIVRSFSLEVLTHAVGYIVTSRNSDLLHTFNTLLLNRKPWVVSFESLLPRTWFSKRINAPLFSLVARDECRAVLASSENAKVHVLTRNDGHPRLDQVLRKVRVVYPGIEDYPNCYQRHVDKGVGEELHLVFIGHEFFRKGGTIAVRAYERLRKRFPIRLTVVSSMIRTAIAQRYLITPQGTAEEWATRMKDLGVTYIRRLPYSDVRELLSSADILLLPTLDDSFGFSVVEAMATGVVPVATKIRALPEIISHGKDGVLLNVETTPEGRLDSSRTKFEDIEEALVAALEDLFEDKSKLQLMGERARRTYEKKFTQARLASDLAEVYAQAVQDVPRRVRWFLPSLD